MVVNGKQTALSKEISISEFLRVEGYAAAKVVVERNGEIVPAQNFDRVMLKDCDRLEIISFVGGG